jgi:SPP1 gp7 family putative phage head morphogenesis protein
MSNTHAAKFVSHLIKLRQSSGLRKLGRRQKLPRQVYPKTIEREYAKVLQAHVEDVRAAHAHLMSELPRLLDDARAERGDELQHRRFAGMLVVTENPVGSVRSWRDPDGTTTGETTMQCDYGYIDGVQGADKEWLDCYLGPDEDAPFVYVVRQMRGPQYNAHDEDKCMIGFSSMADAVNAYHAHRNDPRAFGGVKAVSTDDFRRAVMPGNGVIFRTDAKSTEKAAHLLAETKKQVSAIKSDVQLHGVAQKVAAKTAAHNKVQLARQTKAALGVEVHAPDKALHIFIDHFAHENAALISTLNETIASKIAGLVIRAVGRGTMIEDLAKQIDERYEVSKAHARLIARDQVGKLYGQINGARQKELGVKRFIWRTVGDDHVRDEHEELEAKSEAEPFSFDDPPDEGMPGEPIQCRCVSEPVFEELIDEIDQEQQDEQQPEE